MPLPPGTRLGPYEVIAPIGAGGMGEVYRARDTRLGRDVAVKVVQASLAGTTSWQRFEREARAASSLNQPNICAVYDVGEDAGQPYLVMELLEGQTLRDYTGRQPADPADVIAIGAQIADALEAAHAKRVIHRDIKAGNIMVVGRGHVKVLDFGLATYATLAAEASDTPTVQALTSAGTIPGTPHYMAPEVLQGRPADARSDLWSLGVVLHEMLTGGLPFQGATPFEVTSAILRAAPPAIPASVPAGLRTIVERCLAKRPDARYQSASEVRAAFDVVRESGVPARAAPGRMRWLWPVAGIAVLTAGVVWMGQRPPAQPPETAMRTLSNGAPASAVREANEAFELAIVQLRHDTHRAEDLLRRAISLDPRFAAARQLLATTYVVQIIIGASNDAGLLYSADEELRRAAREDPSRLAFQADLAGIALMQGNKQGALAEVNRILAREPMAMEARMWRAALHLLTEENAEAKAILMGIMESAPLFPPARIVLTEMLLTEGDSSGALREALTLSEQAPDSAPSVGGLSNVYMATGELGKARGLLEDKRAVLGSNYRWRVSWALLLALEDKPGEALRALDDETLKWADVAHFGTLHVAEVYALSRDTSRAIDWIDRAVRKGDERIDWFRRNPRLASVQQEPGFHRIIAAIEARRQRKVR